MTVSLPRWRCSSRPRLGRAGSGRLGAGAWPRTAEAALFVLLDGSAAAAAGFGRRLGSAASASSSALRGAPLRRQLPRPCDSLRRGGALPRSARALACSSRRRASSSAVRRASSASRSSFACSSLRVVISSCGGRLARRPGRPASAPAPGAAAPRRPAWAPRRGGASPGRPRMRRFLTSTTTVFERPWLKLCLTLPVSTVRLRPSGGRVPSFGFSVWSAILFLRQISSAEPVLKAGSPPSRPTIGVSESPPPGKRVSDTRSGSGIGQGDMYHIFAPQVPSTR